MTSRDFLRIIKRYTKGKSNPAEEKIFDVFFDSFSSEPDRLALKSEKEKQEIGSEIYNNVQRSIHLEKPVIFLPVWFKIAASIIAITGAFLLFRLYYPTSVEYTTYQNKRGERTEFVLEDGSIIKLNAESSLTVPKHFSTNNRTVTLTGEAFFEIQKNKNKPFIVTSGDLTTTVLGTSFNIKAFMGSLPSVSVMTGKVKVESNNVALKQIAFLDPGEQVTLTNNQLEKRTNNINSETAWTEGTLFLNDISMMEAAELIERWYNVKIIFKNESLKACYIKAKYKNESLESVLKNLGAVLNMRYSLNNTTVILSGNGKCN